MVFLDSNDDDKNEPTSGMPRWVKVSLIVVVVLVLTFIVLQFLGIGGRHGPGRHMQHSGSPVPSTNVNRAPA